MRSCSRKFMRSDHLLEREEQSNGVSRLLSWEFEQAVLLKSG
jgi:hypothetical protein